MTICLIIWLLIFSFACWRKLEYGIYLVVFTLPCYLLRPKIFAVPTTVLELEIYILFLAWLIKNKSNIKHRIVGFFKKQLGFILPTFLIFFGASFSTIFSSDFQVSFGILKGWFFDPLIFSTVIFSSIKTKKQTEQLLSSLAISGIFVAVISLFYYFLGNLTFDGRLKAFYLSPNHLAMYLAPCLLLATCNLQLTTKRFLKYLWTAGAFLMAIVLYLTYSYSTWFGIFGGLFFLNTLFLKEKKKILGFLGLIILIILLFYLQLDSPKLQNLIESPRSSFQSRIMVWQAAFKMIKDNPIWGIGPGMFQEYYLNYQKYFPSYLEWAVPQPHNLFLAFLMQCGIIGFAGFIWLLTWFFRSGFSKPTTNPEGEQVPYGAGPAPEQARYGAGNYQLATILMSIMVYVLVHGLVDTTYWKNDLSLVFWLTISLMAILVAKPS